MRVLFILVAVLVAVLAFVLDQPMLYWAAGALLVGGLVALGVHLWGLYSESKQYKGNGDDRRSEELNDLGIMDVRPQGQQDAADEESAETPAGHDAPADEKAAPDDEERPAANSAKSEEAPSASESKTPKTEARTKKVSSASSGKSDKDAVMTPYLRSLRAALGAQTVALLVQEEMALQYRIEAAESQSRRARKAGSFSTSEPLLTAQMSRRAVTVRAVGKDGIPMERLGYYKTTESVAQVALAPVPSPEETATYFLVADAKDEDTLTTSRAQRLLRHYAELLGVLLDTDSSPRVREAAEAQASADVQDEDEASDEGDEDASQAPRPRREIIAEEMEAAFAEDYPLALALVHLNRAEAIAEDGEEAVAEAEQALYDRLVAAVPDGRVERFGELTFGIFYASDVAEVEPWAEQLQADMAEASGTLEGGVSIGVAMLDERHEDPDDFRADATEALRVAYETGTCTIVE